VRAGLPQLLGLHAAARCGGAAGQLKAPCAPLQQASSAQAPNTDRSLPPPPAPAPQDGDLDANWVESMNSVMDDSRLLTLPSNERIRLLPHMKVGCRVAGVRAPSGRRAARGGCGRCAARHHRPNPGPIPPHAPLFLPP
jgi:hypothetical protein